MTVDVANFNKPELTKNRPTKKILLTRPQGSNETLAVFLRQQGYDVRILPLLEIQHYPETTQVTQTVINIDHYQHIICSSQHAANILADYVDQYWPQLPLGIAWYALGKGSAAPLERLSLEVILPKTGNTSEDLLAMPPLTQISGQKVLLAKGKGGRTELEQTLTKRGAQLAMLELYQRVPVKYADSVLQDLLTAWQPDMVVLLSGETIERFSQLCRNLQQTRQNPNKRDLVVNKTPVFIVPSQRLATTAERLSYSAVVTESAEPDKILKAINDCM